MAWEVMGPNGEATSMVLLDGCDVSVSMVLMPVERYLVSDSPRTNDCYCTRMDYF